MKKMGNEGTQKGGKSKPYAGPMYSSGTKDMDTKNTSGPVAGPTVGKGTPDPLNYTRK